jgi:hypothetical protein
VGSTKLPEFKKINSRVKTADGKSHEVTGFLSALVIYKGKETLLKLFVIPSLEKNLILGIDFWKAFNLAPGLISSLECEDSKVEEKETNAYPLDSRQKQQLEAVKLLFPSFATQGLGKTSLIEHKIEVGDATPIKQRFYPVSPAVEKLMFEEVDKMIELGVIEKSNSAWSSPMRLVVKPGKVRLCLDARKVNDCTKKDAYPLPSIEGIFARLPQANLISKIDLKDAYWQVPLSDASRPITTFTVPGRPLYQFRVMPFGLCNAPQTMSRLMDEVIPPDLKYCCFGYLDDLCVVSADFDSHLIVLLRLAEQFRKANLTLNIEKSNFCVTEVKYLGFIIGKGGISTDPGKIESIVNWPAPKSIKQVRGFLGLAGWYRRFIANFSEITTPITNLLSGKKKFIWTEGAQNAFDQLKAALTSAPVLQNPDFKRKFYLHCDASDYGVGAVLVQLNDAQEERPVAYMSKKLNSAQRNYSVTERECLAVILGIERFRCYLELQEFEVVTDHSSLSWLMRQANLKGRLARWAMNLQGHKFTISHRKGKEHVVPDALSRMYSEELAAIEYYGPEVDLESPSFEEEAYKALKAKVMEDPEAYPDRKIIGKHLYIRTEHANGNSENNKTGWKLWIPQSLTNSVIQRAHDTVICAHGGTGKTLELIRRCYYWPGMVVQVREYVRLCEVCKSTKAPNTTLKPPMGQQAESSRPFQRLYIDLLGPYPRSKQGHIGLLIVLDHFSKFHWLLPLRKFTAKAIMEFLQNHIFFSYGVPEIIISDNGSQFKAQDFNAFLTEFGVKHQYMAVYSPQSNASERVNRSIIAAIRAYLEKDHNAWDEHIPAISCSLRNSVHQSIQCAPYQALYGFNMVTHGSQYKLLKNLGLLDESCGSSYKQI